ncbi:unnamed protein product [Neospora caninum Liverpool]|uniref:AP2 domain transcription factor AP2IV-3 n=1 Tax=Neospora caninum (strain Liverpool) TaxID=572307 RepID=F0VAD6_NEOCL|nr:uncharacterized protein NCLIV_010930 [Neospora caninum Liverpool]CBZ50625.1 unnamed protein product [Neospora caninum Liverpool]CEL65237.1 TPA: AP2 domain transcription factor AP2IV-3 [Neospora caninum Liverpool]|eukprot:XP_003880658.1 uncharacterized protein NCLIV_010930 [Neospora caninum Liverpool]
MADDSRLRVIQPKSTGRSGFGGSLCTTVSSPTPSTTPPQRNGREAERAHGHKSSTREPSDLVSSRFTKELFQGEHGATKTDSKLGPGARRAEVKRSGRRMPPRPTAAGSGGSEEAQEASMSTKQTVCEHVSCSPDSEGSSTVHAADILKAVADRLSPLAAAPLGSSMLPEHHECSDSVREMTTSLKCPEEKLRLSDKRGGPGIKDISPISRLSSRSTVWHQSDVLNRDFRSFSSVGFEPEDLLQRVVSVSGESDDPKDKERFSAAAEKSVDGIFGDSIIGGDTGYFARHSQKTAPESVGSRCNESSREMPVNVLSLHERQGDDASFAGDSGDRDAGNGRRPSNPSSLRALASAGSEAVLVGLGDSVRGWRGPDRFPQTDCILRRPVSVGGMDHGRSPRDSLAANEASLKAPNGTSPSHADHLSSILRSRFAQQLALQQLQEEDHPWWRPERTPHLRSSSRAAECHSASGVGAASWMSRAGRHEEAVKPKRAVGLESSETVTSISSASRRRQRSSPVEGSFFSDSGEADAVGESDDSGAADAHLRGAKRQRWDSEEEDEEDAEEVNGPVNDPGEETRVQLVREARKFPPFRGVYFDTRRGNLSWRCSWKVHGKKRSRSWSVMKFGMARARAKAIAERIKHAPPAYSQSPLSSMNSQTGSEASPSLHASPLLPALMRSSRGVRPGAPHASGVSPSSRSHGASPAAGLGASPLHQEPVGSCSQSSLQASRSNQLGAEEELTCGKRSVGRMPGGTRERTLHSEDHEDDGEPLTAVLRRVLSMKESQSRSLEESQAKVSKRPCHAHACMYGRPDSSDGPREEQNALSKADLSSILKSCSSPFGARRVSVRDVAEPPCRCAHSSPQVANGDGDLSQLLNQTAAACCSLPGYNSLSPEGEKPSVNGVLHCLRENSRVATLLAHRSPVNPSSLSDLAGDDTVLATPEDLHRAVALLERAPLSGNPDGDFLPFGQNLRNRASMDFRRTRDDAFDEEACEGTRLETPTLVPVVGDACLDDKCSDEVVKEPKCEGLKGRAEGGLSVPEKETEFPSAHAGADSLAGASTTTSADERSKLALGAGPESSPWCPAQIPVRSAEALLRRVVSAATAASAGRDKAEQEPTQGNPAGTVTRESPDADDSGSGGDISTSINPQLCNEIECTGNGLRAASAAAPERPTTDATGTCREVGFVVDSASDKMDPSANAESAGLGEAAAPGAREGRSSAYPGGGGLTPTTSERLTKDASGQSTVLVHRARVLEVLQNLKEFSLPLASKGQCQTIQCASASLVLLTGSAAKDGRAGEKGSFSSRHGDLQFTAWCSGALDDLAAAARTGDVRQLEPLTVLLGGCLAELRLPASLSESEQLALLASVMTYYCNRFDCSRGNQEVVSPSVADAAA